MVIISLYLFLLASGHMVLVSHEPVFDCVQIFYTDLDRTNWSPKMVVFSGESLHSLLGRHAVCVSS